MNRKAEIRAVNRKAEIRAGELNTWATFRRSTKLKSTSGQVVETWADACTVPAKKETTGGGEFYAAQKKNAETTALVTVRYTQKIDDRMRLKHGNREYEILPPINDVDNAHIKMLVSCKEVV